MKKLFLTLGSICFMLIATAQVGINSAGPAAQTGGDGAFPKGTSIINAGVGFGDPYWGAGYTSSIPVSPTLSFDHAITGKLGIGTIGVGGIVAYGASKYSDGTNTYDNSGFMVGVRGTYHFILNMDNLDPYGGVMLGYIFTSHSTPQDYGYGYGYVPKDGGVVPGVFVGCHYFFGPAFGVGAEAGYLGLYVFSVGVSFRFGGGGSASK